MANQHAKCPRCGRRGKRWGGRRRHCPACGVTWRIRKKKVGRKQIRRTPKKAIQYLKNHESRLPRFSTRTHGYRRVLSRESLRKRLSWPEPPRAGPLILIADAFLHYAKHSWYTWYCIFVRTIEGEDAVILEPFYCKGTEVAAGWEEAFALLPHSILKRTKTLVSDGHNGLILEARRRGWLVQRCHFHLIARLQSKRSRWRRGFHQEEGRKIYDLVKVILETRSLQKLKESLRLLARIGNNTTSRDVRRVISGIMTNYQDYRTYLSHPELNLPTTNNTAEAFIALVRNLSHRAHGFKTVQSFNYWIEALVKTRRTIKCRSKNQPN